MVVVMITDYVKRCFILLKYDTMGEEQGDLTVERIAKIRRAVKKASELGIKDRGQRREAVIDAQSAKEEGILDISQEEARAFPSVAKADIRTESRQVQERAINKYLEVEEGDRNVPVLVDAVHDAPPAPSTIRHILRQDGLEASLDEIKDSLGRIVGNGEPKSELDQKVKAVWTASFDMNTGLIARQVARVLKASVIVAKKPRTHADPNRTWRFRKTAPIEGVNKYLAREYPRSVLAAFYWAARRILQSQNLLDDSGRLKKQFLRVAIHGMVDRGGYDLAVGGSLRIADPEVVEKFAETLQKKIVEQGLLVEGEVPKVVIARPKDPQIKMYSGAPVLATHRRELEGRVTQYPPFGENFQAIQLEISNRLRTDSGKRNQVARVISGTIREIIQEE